MTKLDWFVFECVDRIYVHSILFLGTYMHAYSHLINQSTLNQLPSFLTVRPWLGWWPLTHLFFSNSFKSSLLVYPEPPAKPLRTHSIDELSSKNIDPWHAYLSHNNAREPSSPLPPQDPRVKSPHLAKRTLSLMLSAFLKELTPFKVTTNFQSIEIALHSLAWDPLPFNCIILWWRASWSQWSNWSQWFSSEVLQFY